nr:hypothetical protein [Rhodoferax sp.]
MTPQDFIAKWGAPDGVPGPAYALNEEQGAQSHFLDLCELLGVPKPGSTDGYRFEEKSKVIGGRTGYADVFMRGVFAWENKAPGKNLDAALKQLLTYSLALSNPPILVVSDRLIIRIHTQFTGHPSETHEVRIAEIDLPEKLALLRRIWTAPESFKPRITNREITEKAAISFSALAEGLRRRGAETHARAGQTPGAHGPSVPKSPPSSAPLTHEGEHAQATQQRANQVAHFLTQCLFCFFAEDVGLLPGRMFERLVTNRKITCDKLTQGLADLFTAMGDGGMFGADEIPWFNGGLFKTIDVPQLTILDVTELRNAANLNWSAIDVSIFGTLFERGLDPAKRSQLGAHYTDPATILRIIEPVVQRPLLQLWEQTAIILRGLLARSTKKGDKDYRAAQAKFIEWLDSLHNYRVLDPACGSGNFLFLGLKALKDIEHRSHLEAAALGLDREADLVTGPHNVLGIELNEYAAELARVTVWIGELQWRMAHGYEFKTNPVLEPLDHIECRDALLSWDSEARAGQMPGAHALRSLKSPPTSAPPTPLPVRAELIPVRAEPVEATWPQASVVIGNPPFLGGSKKRRELGDAYFEALDSVFTGRVPGGADLVCYWFDKARVQMQSGQLQAAGLVATQAIRAGANRTVLERLLHISNSEHNPDHGNSNIRHAATGRAIAHSGHSTGTGRGRGARDRQEPGQPRDQGPFRQQTGEFTRSTAHRPDGIEVDDGLDDRRGDVTGAQDLLLTVPPLSIFNAWADEPWVNNGAAVRVSLVCFGIDAQAAELNGQTVACIHADLTGGDGLDLTSAQSLVQNYATAFKGAEKSGAFEIDGRLARQWLSSPNPHRRSNAEVVLPWRNGADLSDRPKDHWVIDYGVDMPLSDAAMFQEPFSYITVHVKLERMQNKDRGRRENWWRFGRNGADMRQGIAGLARFVVTPRVAKHRYFSWLAASISPDSRLLIVARADDATFGVLSSRIHEVWSLAQASMHGVGNDPTYNAKSCFETYPFPVGLTPADTAHQKTEEVAGGAWIPAGLAASPSPQPSPARGRGGNTNNLQHSEAGVGRRLGAILKSEAYEPPASAPPLPSQHQQPKKAWTPSTGSGRTEVLSLRDIAIAIANAAKRLNDLRENWLNPPEWAHKVPEVTPLGMSQSPYPDRIEPRPGITEIDLKALQQRTLTKLYNTPPAWLTLTHQQLDAAVAAAYGWTDYTLGMPDEEILKRLLALNLERADASKSQDTTK